MQRVKILLLLIILIIHGCRDDRNFPEPRKLAEFKNTDFLLTLEHEIKKDKNSIYCSTLLLAWDEIKNTIKSPLQINPSYYDLYLLNRSQSYSGTLGKDEYFSQANVNGDLIMARAEFKKSLPFEWKLNSFDDKLIFENQEVKSFGVIGNDYEISKAIQVLYYKNDDNFILRLLPKDREHEIILQMTTRSFQSMSDLVTDFDNRLTEADVEKQNSNLSWKFYLSDYDEVIIPKFSFNIETNYSTLEGKTFKTAKRNFKIEEAWQRTAFILDEMGAELESEAEAAVTLDSVAVEEERPRPKKMKFNKPFFLMLKRVDSKNPYFGLWVANSQLMQKK